MKNVNYEILKEVPISGFYEEIYFGNDVSNDLLWVEFFDDKNYWIGKFEKGNVKQNNKIIINSENNLIFVLASGVFYIIDLNNKKSVFVAKNEMIEDFEFLKNKNKIILTDGLYLFILDLENKEIIWQSERISWDGVIFTKNIENKIEGFLNDLSEQKTNCKFVFDTNKREIIANYNCKPV